MVRCSLPASGSSPEPVACWCNCEKNPPVRRTKMRKIQCHFVCKILEFDDLLCCGCQHWHWSLQRLDCILDNFHLPGSFRQSLGWFEANSAVKGMMRPSSSQRSGNHSLKYVSSWWSLNIPTGLAPKRLGRTSKPIWVWGWEYLLHCIQLLFVFFS